MFGLSLSPRAIVFLTFVTIVLLVVFCLVYPAVQTLIETAKILNTL